MKIELLLLLLLGVVVLIFRGKLNRRSRIRRKQIQSNGKGFIIKLHPFDAKKAKPQTGKSIMGRVRVIDGDTIIIDKTQLRLFGIDAPEINHPYGQKAKWALVSLCKGQIVQAEITEQDDYGRAVAKCILQDGRDASAEMVKLGLAIDWSKFSGGLYRSLECLTYVKNFGWQTGAKKGECMFGKNLKLSKNCDPQEVIFEHLAM